MDLYREFERLVRTFEDSGIDYAVAGALAVAIHGAPRATTDIDLLVLPGALGSALAAARLCGFTVEALPMRFRDGMEVRRVTRFEGEEMLTLDLLLVDPNLRSIWDSRTRIESEFGTVRVISREALIRMKIAAGRPRDLGDVESLQEMDR